MKFSTAAFLYKGAISLILLLGIGAYQVNAQVTVTASAGTASASYVNISDAFSSINAGTHQGSILISVNASTTEPATAVPLLASGQGASTYTDILVKPTAVVTVSATPAAAGQAVLVLDGADNVTIDGSIAMGGTSRDMTIQNTALNTQVNVAVIRLISRTTAGLGCSNIQIKNNIILGNTSGNNGFSGSTVTSTYGIYAASTTTTLSYTTAGGDFDNCVIENNSISNCYHGIILNGAVAPNTADNNIISKNDIGSAIDATSVSLRGIYTQHNVGTIISDNKIDNMSVSTTISPAAIEITGTASSAVQILRNKISKIHSSNSGGYGAIGITVGGGANHILANNLIYDIKTSTYSNTTTSFDAFGIRISGGTGLGIYYNSIHLYDVFTNSTSNTLGTGSAMVVSSTSVTLTASNNIFNNAYTSAGTMQRTAVWFPNTYNFANATLQNNYYGIQNIAGSFVGKVGTVTYADLSAWKAVSQVGNPTNDANSQPSINAAAPFTSNSDLTIPTGTVTGIESGGLIISALGSPNKDYTNTNRPAGTGTAPDMGAYEFNGSAGDFTAPIVSSLTQTPVGNACSMTARTIDATITDNVGVTSASLTYSYNGVAQTPLAMSMTAGSASNGVWTAVIPAAPSTNTQVTFFVKGTDANSNVSSNLNGTPYTDAILGVDAGADQTINLGSSATLTAKATGIYSPLIFTEVIQFKTGTGAGTYPAYIGTEDNDFIEVTNISSNPVDLNGWTIQTIGVPNATYTFSFSAIVAPGQTAFFALSTTGTDSPANGYYKLGIGSNSSSSATGYILKNPFGEIADAFASNNYAFNVASGVTTFDWSGNSGLASGLCGYTRNVATDNNVAGDWSVTSASNLSTPNAVNTTYAAYSAPSYLWSPGGQTTKSISVTPSPSGTYTYQVTISNGVCSHMDSVKVTVQPPITPVANFTGTPLNITAGSSVTFTDASQNVPSAWSWSVSPGAGVSFVSGTNANSQNPVIKFDNAGSYSITLYASNSAGQDDSTRMNYVQVAFCSAAATSTADTDIGNVTFAGINQGTASPVTSNSTATGTYTDYSSGTHAMVEKGGTYPLSLSQITQGSTFYGAWFNVFIDWDGDGSFNPITERVFTSPSATSSGSPTQTANIVVPTGAMVGTVKMRVLLNESGSATQAPCGNFTYGEVEDYLVDVVCPTVPSPTSANQSLCSGSTATFTATSSYSAGSIVKWHDAMTGGTVLATGLSFTTPTLTTTTMYYVSDSLPGCAPSARAAYSANVTDVNVVITPEDVTCNGGSDGSFIVSDTLCGTAPFTYSINSGAFGMIPTNLSAGTYSVVVKDVNNLLSSAYSIVISQPTFTVNPPSSGGNLAICQGEGSALISAMGSLSSQIAKSDTIVVASAHSITGVQTVNFPVSFTIPSNATVTSTSIVFTNVTTSGGNWPSDANVSSTGDIVLASKVVAPVNVTVTNAGPYPSTTSNALSGLNNAVISLQNTYTGTMVSNILVVVNYNLPDSADVRWYSAASGGSLLGSGSDLEAIGTSVLPSSSTPGVYTFYAEGEYNTCTSSSRTAVTVTVKANSSSAIAPTVCDSYTAPSGAVYTASGAYSDTIANAAGCDSIISIQLTVLQSTTASISATECSSYTAPSGAQYTASGTYTDVIQNAAGCDSTITIQLTILQPSSSTVTVSTCDLYQAPSGALYNQTGTYTDVIQNAAGCDSTITIHLTRVYPSSSQISVTTCGDYTAPSGAVYTSSGTYTDVIPNAAGCDSTITIQLSLTQIDPTVSQNSNVLSANESQAVFQWLDCANNFAPIQGATNQIFIAQANGTYAVRIQKGQCIDTSSCVVMGGVGIDETTLDYMRVSPNPSTGIFTVNFEEAGNAQWIVMDAQGKVILSSDGVKSGDRIDLSNHERGMYLLTLKTDKGTKVERLIKN